MSGMPDLAAKYKDEDLCFEYRLEIGCLTISIFYILFIYFI